jgi:hypothetical protein
VGIPPSLSVTATMPSGGISFRFSVTLPLIDPSFLSMKSFPAEFCPDDRLTGMVLSFGPDVSKTSEYPGK